jgi:galactokinase/mevalonate kinase-like predicted kinase
MLAAVPKGSGLGTSSILAATTLAVLSDMLGHNWDKDEIFSRTLALEQILTSGGGWQDQAGGMYPGVKMVSTAAGLTQKHELRWLPGELFSSAYVNRRIMLYYTGLTRTAHDILGQIVKGFFRNEAARIRIVEDIAANAGFVADALQRNDLQGLCEGIRRSWVLNRQLDPGTNPPAVQEIIQTIGDDACALKLAGAGGGGFMLILAHDDASGERIRARLASAPPNPRARFVDLSISTTGLQVTRS